MCDPISIGVGALVAGAAGNTISGMKQASAAKKAARRAEKLAMEEAARDTRAFNKANGKTPDFAALLNRARSSTSGGIGSTMLTGPNGVAAGSIPSGRDTLIGRNTILGA